MSTASLQEYVRQRGSATRGSRLGSRATLVWVRAEVLEASPNDVDSGLLLKTCPPNLETFATARLTLGDTEIQSDAGHLELRFGVLLGRASFVAHEGSALETLVPSFSAQPVEPPTLDVWIEGIDTDGVASTWRWSASVPCMVTPCAGSPLPGATVQTTGEEKTWGTPTLTRAPAP